jgi:O-antigen/teichoic acid export membrane protein
MSSLKKNIVFNYIGQFYNAFIGILILPLYLQELGGEAFGLIGFLTLLLAWLQLLDLGLTPTLGREVSRLKNKPESHHELRTVVRSLEVVFIALAAIIVSVIFINRTWIATDWLDVKVLDLNDVAKCIGIMAFMVGFRWVSSLYKSGVYAYEQQVWASIVDLCLVTLRFPVALAVVIISDGDLILYFTYQLVLSVVEYIVYSKKLSKLMPDSNELVKFSKASLARIAPFALAIGYTAGIWVLVTQLDKLLLSKLLPLIEYGYFTLIATLAGGVMLLSGPVGKAVLPRMTALLSEGREQEMLAVYLKGTRIVTASIAPIVFVISLYSTEVVYIWTGSREASEWVGPILPIYVLGYGLLTIGAFQYYLQYAHGKLKQHVLYNTFSALISIPLIIYSAFTFGPIGVAWVWLIFRLLSFLFWAPYIHHKFAPGLHFDWLLKNVVPAIATSVVLLALINQYGYSFDDGRFIGFIYVSFITVVLFTASVVVSFIKEIKGFFSEKF